MSTSTTLRTFSITSRRSGTHLGTFDAEDEHAAKDAMAREAGYRDFADKCRRSGDDGLHLRVVEIVEITPDA